MQGKLEPFRVGEVDVLIETVVVPGSQPVSGRTKGANGVVERSIDALDQAGDVIRATAERVASLLDDARKEGIVPDEITVAFGVSFTVEGGIVLAKGSASSTLEVTLTYKAQPVGSG